MLLHTTGHCSSTPRGQPHAVAPHPTPGPGLRPQAASSAPPCLTTSPAANCPIGRRDKRTGTNQRLLTQVSLHPLPRPQEESHRPLHHHPSLPFPARLGIPGGGSPALVLGALKWSSSLMWRRRFSPCHPLLSRPPIHNPPPFPSPPAGAVEGHFYPHFSGGLLAIVSDQLPPPSSGRK